MNKIVIVGRLGGDPDSVFFQSGTALVQFSLAVNRPFKNQKGERETDWFKCKTTKEGLVKYAKEYLKKGDQVAISGAMPPAGKWDIAWHPNTSWPSIEKFISSWHFRAIRVCKWALVPTCNNRKRI
jgi:hypothetical protein